MIMFGGGIVGQSRRRVGRDGVERYTAYYTDIQGRRRSAGTFSTKGLADRAWARAERDLDLGHIGDPKRGKQTLRHYVENEWFRHHVMEETTRENYRYLLNRYILPELGGLRMRTILPGHLREWIGRLGDVHRARPPTIRQCKVIVDAILTAALNDQVTVLHAGKGVKTPPVAKKAKRIITAAQFDTIYQALEEEVMRLLVETDVESGLRWGELTELRVKDLDLDSGMLTVSRVVVHLKSTDRPDGQRFVVKEYPKDKEWRQLRLADHIIAKLHAFIDARGLAADDLLFEMPQPGGSARRRRPAQLPDPATLGLTEPNANGRQYAHGTLTAYQAGRCRCEHCKNAVADYRARRRADGKDTPRPVRTVASDGHIGNDWFRTNVWAKALAKADLGFHVTPHGLRHAHASWLLAGGADLQVVKERLGHGSITTTEKYLHTLPGADTAALTALDAIRGRRDAQTRPTTTPLHATPAEVQTEETNELGQMRQMLAQMQELLERGGTRP
jgi:integrase